ncbi:MAG: Mrp/NBP35 family ATP-binding protein [Nitrososphaerales archaeon]
MLTKSKILEALSEVVDPEIGLNIVELGMVRDIKVEDGVVKILIALTVPSCPLANTIKSDVEKNVKKLNGVKAVSVETTSMSKEELDRLKGKLQQKFGKKAATAGIEKLDKKNIAHIIAVVSGKGGVGKSSISALLATELRRMGYEVGVLDADVTGPSIAKLFNLTDRPRISQNGILPLTTKSGIKAISVNLLLDDPEQAVVWRGPIVSNVIKQLYSEVDWGDLHFLIIDLPPGTSDAPLTVYQSIPIDGVVVVSTPQDLALMIVAKAVNMARSIKVPVLGLIENMGYLICPHCGGKINLFGEPKGEKAAKKFNIPFLGVIPLDPKMTELADKGLIEDYQSIGFTEVANNFKNNVLKSLVDVSPLSWKKP